MSAGFDPHRADPLGGMRVTERGFAAMCSAMKSLAESDCEGKLVLLLEGGYSLEGLSQSVHACVEVLAGRRDSFPPGRHLGRAAALAKSREALKPYWPTCASGAPGRTRRHAYQEATPGCRSVGTKRATVDSSSSRSSGFGR